MNSNHASGMTWFPSVAACGVAISDRGKNGVVVGKRGQKALAVGALAEEWRCVIAEVVGDVADKWQLIAETCGNRDTGGRAGWKCDGAKA